LQLMQIKRLVEHEGQQMRPRQSEILSLHYRNPSAGSV